MNKSEILRMRIVNGLIVVFLILCSQSVLALPQNFTLETVVPAVTKPTNLISLPDGRMIVTEQTGQLKLFDPDSIPASTSTILDLPNVNGVQERGLASIALDPDFSNNGYLYLYYTSSDPGNRNQISRFTFTGNTVVANSEVMVWEDNSPATSCCHFGGGMDFGPDNMLYLATGEEFGGSQAQDLTEAGGKIIRVDISQIDQSGPWVRGGANTHIIPTDNPLFNPAQYPFFANAPAGALGEIWALGLRNPFRAHWDIPGNRFYIGEVGGNVQATAQEDLHVGRIGANYGWPNCEGICADPTYDDPIYTYDHTLSTPNGGAIAAGVSYRGSTFPSSYQGVFFFSDYTLGYVKYLTFLGDGSVDTVEDFDTGVGSPVASEVGTDGSLYVVDYGGTNVGAGRIVRYVHNSGNQPPVITAVSANFTPGSAPLTVDFSVSASDPDSTAGGLTYEWFFGDSTEVSGGSTIQHQYQSNGQYNAFVRVSDATLSTNSDLIPIQIGVPPIVTIDFPVDGSTFRAGDTVAYQATVQNATQSPPYDYQWNIDFNHNDHIHPGNNSTGPSGSFDINTMGHDYHDNTGYTLRVTVTDSLGLVSNTQVQITPEKVDMNLSTVPAELDVLLDGLAIATNGASGFDYDTVIGFEHVLAVPQSICSAGEIYDFQNWSGFSAGQPRVHSITVPASNLNLVANFTTTGASCVERVSTDLQALYNFDEGGGSIVNDSSGLSPVNLFITDPSQINWGSGALSVDGETSIESMAASRINDAISNSNEITLEAWVTPSNLNQTGPARIAGLSSSGTLRNATLGQTADSINVRLRTTTTGLNGISPSLSSPAASLSNELTHVVYTRTAAGLATIFVDNNVVATATIAGDLSTWSSAYGVILANEFGSDRPWLGVFDLVAIYSRALSAGEVDQNFQAGPGATNPVTDVAPLAVADPNESVDDGQSVVINVLGNDTDVNNNIDASSVAITLNGQFGTATANPADGTVTYVHTPGAGGTVDTFEYEVSDTTTPTPLTSNTAVVTVTINDSNTPFPQSNLVAHFEADMGVLETGGTVQTWEDQSPEGNDLTAFGGPQLITGSNGESAIDFDQVGDRLSIATPSGLATGSTDRTVYMVASYTAGARGGVSYGAAADNEAFGLIINGSGVSTVQGFGVDNDFSAGGDVRNAGWIVQSAVLSSGTMTHSINGLVVDTQTKTPAYATGNDLLMLGAEIGLASFMDMEIGAVLIYDTALNVSEQAQVESYLQSKYVDEPVGDVAPLAVADPNESVDDGQSVLINVLGNDTDVNNNIDASSVAITLNGQFGTATANPADGTVTYVHTPGAGGTVDTFEYEVSDTTTPTPLTSNTAVVTVAINSVGGGTRVTAGQEVLYTFDQNPSALTTVADVSGETPALDLTIADLGAVTWGSGTLSIDSSTTLESALSATRLSTAVKGSNEVTVEAWITPSNLTQTGPSRIAGLSNSSNRRNVTLGQVGDDVNVRLRTTTTGLNGSAPALESTGGQLSAGQRHVVYTRAADGTATLYVDSAMVETGTIGGNLSTWADAYTVILANEIGGGRAWLGEFDLVAIYSRALSAGEVDQNFQAGPGDTNPVTDVAPLAVADPNESVDDGQSVVINVLGNDTDVNNNIDASSVEITLNGQFGTATANPADGTVTYVHTPGAGGTQDTFEYKVSDTTTPTPLTSNTAVVTVTIDDGSALIPQSGLVAHYEADMGVIETGGTVQTWEDQSPEGNDLTAFGDPQLLVGSNGQLAIDFDQTADRLSRSAPSGFPEGMANRTVYLVASYKDGHLGGITYGTAAENQSFGLSINIQGNSFVNGFGGAGQDLKNGGWMMQSAILDNNFMTHSINGVEIDSKFKEIATGNDILMLGAQINLARFMDMQIGAVLVYDRVLNASQRSQVENYLASKYLSTETRVAADLQALYTFDQNPSALTTVADVSGETPALDLTIADLGAVTWGDSTLSIDTPTSLESALPATRFNLAAKASREVTIEAWITPSDLTDTGLARIVSVSENRLRRNVTLSQVGNDLNARLRTNEMGQTLNGNSPDLESSNGALSLLKQHVVYTRKSTAGASLYVDNVLVEFDLIGGEFVKWSDIYPVILANEVGGGRPWLGEFDLVAIYSRALTAAEVDRNFRVGSGVDDISPFAVADPNESVGNGRSVVIDVLANDLDANNNLDASSVVITSNGQFGIATANADGTVTYVHTPGAGGAVDTFEYEVSDTTMLASNTAVVTVAINSVGGGTRITAGQEVVYTFDQNPTALTTVADVSGESPALDLTIADLGAVTWGSGTLSINTETTLESALSATRLSTAVKGSNEVTIEAWITPANLTQTGPSRIAGLSNGSTQRNLTLGQVADDVNVRLRTTTTGLNGSAPALESTGGQLSAGQLHVVYTRASDGTSTLYVDDAVVETGTIGGDLSSWADAYTVILASEIGGSRAWLGEFDLVAIYSRALSAAEVMHNFQAGSDGNIGPVTGVTPVAPVAVADPNESVDDGQSVVINVLANDTDLNNNIDASSVAITLNGQFGTATANPADGTVTYVHTPGAGGTQDTFEYEVSDTTTPTPLTSNTAVVTVTINAPADVAPLAVADPNESVDDGQSVLINVLGNDTDANNNIDASSVAITLNGQFGTATANPADGTVTYVHTPGAGGTQDTFEYKVSDTTTPTPLTSNTAVVTVAINSVGGGTRVTAGQEVLYTFDQNPSALTTVADVSGETPALDLTIADLGAVTWGSGTLSIDSSTTLESALSATRLSTAVKGSNEVTVEAWITPSNLTQAGPSRIAGLSNSSNQRNVTLGQVGDDVNVRLRTTTTGLNGSAPALESTGGQLSAGQRHVVYTRAADGTATLYVDNAMVETGTIGGNLSTWADAYTVILANEIGGGRAWLGEFDLVAIYSRALSAGEVDQNFQAGPGDTNPVTDVAPLAVADPNESVDDGQSVVINVLANDTDVNNNIDASSVAITLNGQFGTATANPADGTVTYVHTPGAGGTQDTFEYEVSDTTTPTPLTSNTAVVTVTINAPADVAPLAVADPNESVDDGESVVINVLGNDTDVNNNIDASSVAITLNGQFGTATANPADGTVTYVHTPGAGGTVDTFEYEVSDTTTPTPLTSNTAVVTVTINDSNTPFPQSNLVAHFEADMGVLETGGTVQTWEDQSPEGNDLTAFGGPQLITGSNGESAIDFDQVGDRLSIATPSGLATGSTDRTVYMVASYTAGARGGVSYGAAADNEAFGLIINGSGVSTVQGFGVDNDFSAGGDVRNAGWIVQSAVLSSGTMTHSINGLVVDTQTKTPAYATGNDLLMLGAEIGLASFMDMEIGAVLIYDTALNVSEQAQVESYLQSKYVDEPVGDVAPLAVADPNESVDDGQSVLINVLGNDTDVNNNIDASSVAITLNGQFGTATANPADGTVTYVHTPGAGGTVDTFEYEVSDTTTPTPLTSNTAVVTVAINSVGGGTRVTAGQEVLYTFDQNPSALTTVADVSGETPALDLTIADLGAVTWGSGTLSIDSSTTLESALSATRLSTAVKGSNEVTVEAWITPSNLTQTGPSRIAGLSNSSNRRNVTLGQVGDDVNVRLRTTTTGLNGSAPALESTGGQLSAGQRHVVYTRAADGTATLYVDSAMVETGTIGGNLSTWADAYTVILANEIGGGRAWLGEFDLVAIYSRALSAAEVDQNFQAGPGDTNPVTDVAPLAVADPNESVDDGQSVVINVLGNDTDVNNNIDASSVAITLNGQFGTATANPADGTVTYVHTPGAGGTVDTFEYEVSDTTTPTPLTSNTAVVTVAINSVGGGTRVTAGQEVLYTFDQNPSALTTVADVSGETPALDLTIADLGAVTWGSGTLSIDSSTTLESALSATRLSTAVKGSNEVTVEAWITPSNLTQTGPSRIAGLSNSSNRRNVTLGQVGDDVNVRLRTTTTGLNGSAPALESTGGQLSAGQRHVVYTRAADGTATLYVDSAMVETGTIGGNLSTWADAYTVILANEIGGGRAWLGEFDLVAIYSRALSAGEVDQNFQAGPGDTNPVTDVAPLAVADPNESVDDGQLVLINVLGNDTDANNNIDASSVAITLNGQFGTATANPVDGTVTYVHTPGAGGTVDTFEYEVSDTTTPTPLTSNTAVVTVTINAPADVAPLAVADPNESVDDGQSVVINVLGNDTDVNNNIDASSVAITLNGQFGTATANPADGTVTYVHTPGAGGTVDTFEYEVSDTTTPTPLTSNTAVVTVTINAPADVAPVAVADPNESVDDGQSVVINVLGNDTDVNNNIDASSVAITLNGQFGTATANPADGTVTYVHTPGAGGTVDTFEYEVSDTTTPTPLTSNTAVVTVAINDSNAPFPQSNLVAHFEADVGVTVAADGTTVESWEDQSVESNDLAAFGDPQSIMGSNGESVIDFDQVGDRLSIATPSGLATGSTDRTVYIVASYTAGARGGVSYGAAADNEAFGLIINGSGVSTVQGFGAGNDFSAGGDVRNAGWIVQSAVLSSGTMTHSINGVVVDTQTKTPAYATGNDLLMLGAEIGLATFMEMQIGAVLIYDTALSASEQSQVESYLQSKYVGGSGDVAPVAVADPNESVDDGQSVVINVLGNDTDANNNIDASSVAITLNGQFGTATANPADGTVTYVHTPGAGGTVDTFEYEVSDTTTPTPLTSNTAVVTVTISTAVIPQLGLVAHFEADTGVTAPGGSVQTWEDQSTSENDLTAVGDPQLVTGSTGQLAIDFDQTVDRLDVTLPQGLPTLATDRTMYLVADYRGGEFGGASYGDAADNEAFGLVINGSGESTVQGFGQLNNFSAGGDLLNAGWQIQAVEVNGVTMTHSIDGVVVDTQTKTPAYATGNSILRLGAEIGLSGLMDMQIGALLIYERVLTTNEKTQVLNYLQSKYLDN